MANVLVNVVFEIATGKIVTAGPLDVGAPTDQALALRRGVQVDESTLGPQLTTDYTWDDEHTCFVPIGAAVKADAAAQRLGDVGLVIDLFVDAFPAMEREAREGGFSPATWRSRLRSKVVQKRRM